MNKELSIAAPLFDGSGMFVAYCFAATATPGIIDDWSWIYIPLSAQSAQSNDAAVIAAATAYATGKGYTITNIIDYLYPSRNTISTFTPSLVGTGATGTQVSATKDSTIRANLSVSTTATLAAGATSLIALKICSTNSSTEGNWTTIATLENDQTLGLLGLSLSSLQVVKGQLIADVPAGWYYKFVNSGTGTHTETALAGQQIIYG